MQIPIVNIFIANNVTICKQTASGTTKSNQNKNRIFHIGPAWAQKCREEKLKKIGARFELFGRFHGEEPARNSMVSKLHGFQTPWYPNSGTNL